MRKLNMQLPDQLAARLKLQQERSGLTMTDIVRRALEEYLLKMGV
jgi:predicted DNA-binding protein